MRKLITSSAIGVWLLSGLVYSSTSTAGNILSATEQADLAAATKLSAADMKKMFVGNTLSGKTQDNTPWTEFYVPDGRIKGFWKNHPYKGTWYFAGDKICFNYPKSTYGGCYAAAAKGTEVFFLNNDGTAYEAPATLRAGNPDDL